MNKRTNLRVPLDIYLNKFIGGVPFLVRASDISEEGIYITQLIEPTWLDDKIGLQFVLPGRTEVIYAEGEIMRQGKRTRGQGHGIRFTLLTDRHRRMITEYIDRHEQQAA